MVRLKVWQWAILIAPVAIITGFLLAAAGWQIHQWGLSWIWIAIALLFLGWRWLLVKWTQPAVDRVENISATVLAELESEAKSAPIATAGSTTEQAETALQEILKAAQNDLPIWKDWLAFWQRCQDLVVAIAHIYHPEVKYPLLNIYLPQAAVLIRGTVDDLERWMQKLSPALNHVTVGQAYQAYEVYRQLEPSARKIWQLWNWAQWLLNPVGAVANLATKRYGNQANQELLVNLSQLVREAALRNLCRQAIALYSGSNAPTLTANPQSALPKANTQTLREILAQAEPVEVVEQKPVNILLVGRTGAGKSSLINTLFQADLAVVDALPSTEKLQSYRWQSSTGESLVLWDAPGYEQTNRGDLREAVLDCVHTADLLLLVTPALDPALQMDADFLKDAKGEISDLPAIAAVTQVDRLRPIREWQPPYNWQWGDRPKEVAIREAAGYRAEMLGEYCDRILPVVNADRQTGRVAWNVDSLSVALVEAIAPAKQYRLARFLCHLEARTVAAAQIIDRYTFQMATSQGLTALLKSPVLQFISTLSTGSPTLAYLLAEQIPVEQLPVVIGKLQMAYDLFSLLKTDSANILEFDLLALWPLLLENSAPPERNAWAFGRVLVEYWTQNLTSDDLLTQFRDYLK